MEIRKEGESGLGDLVASREEIHRARAAAWGPPYEVGCWERLIGGKIPTVICRAFRFTHLASGICNGHTCIHSALA